MVKKKIKRRGGPKVRRRAGKKAKVRRGFVYASAAKGLLPGGVMTSVAGGVAGLAATGLVTEMIATRAKPGSPLAVLSSRVGNIGARLAIAVAAGWAVRRFVSKPLGNAVVVGGLTGAVVKTMSGAKLGTFRVPQLLGLGSFTTGEAAGIDPLRPDAPPSLGEMTDEQIQAAVDAARAEAGGGMLQLGDNTSNYQPTEGDVSPAVLSRLAYADRAA